MAVYIYHLDIIVKFVNHIPSPMQKLRTPRSFIFYQVLPERLSDGRGSGPANLLLRKKLPAEEPGL